MRLQKQLSRRVEKKEYAKYVLVLPPKTVKEVGWREGIELTVSVKRTSLVLKPKNK